MHKCSYRYIHETTSLLSSNHSKKACISHWSAHSYCTVLRSGLSPVLIKDFKALEQIQRRATKYILNNYSLDYKEHLLKLQMLPLSMIFELHDLLFFVNSFKQKDLEGSSFNISHYMYTAFSTNSTRSGSHCKLVQPLTHSLY